MHSLRFKCKIPVNGLSRNLRVHRFWLINVSEKSIKRFLLLLLSFIRKAQSKLPYKSPASSRGREKEKQMRKSNYPPEGSGRGTSKDKL